MHLRTCRGQGTLHYYYLSRNLSMPLPIFLSVTIALNLIAEMNYADFENPKVKQAGNSSTAFTEHLFFSRCRDLLQEGKC